jgi:hypothetical protein
MLYTERIERIAEVAIATQYVKDEADSRPVNLMFVTLSGGGKSALLLEKFGAVQGVKALGDVTYDSIAKVYLDQIYRKEIRTLILAEFNKIIGRKATTARNTLGIINELGEEGVPSIDLPFFHRSWEPPVRCNILIGLTPSFLNAHLLDWWGYGFAQRYLFITWNYSKEQETKILRYVQKQLHLKKGLYSKALKEKKIELSERLARKLEDYSIRICEDMTDYVEKLCLSRRWKFDRELERELPFRTQMRLQKFLKAMALVNGRSKVTSFEIREFKLLFNFMNLRFIDLADNAQKRSDRHCL